MSKRLEVIKLIDITSIWYIYSLYFVIKKGLVAAAKVTPNSSLATFLIYLNMIIRVYNLSKNINLFIPVAISEYQISAYYLNITGKSNLAKRN